MTHDAIDGARRRLLGGAMGMAISGGVLARQPNTENTMAQDTQWQDGSWLNRPRTVAISGGTLDVVTDKATDFWRKTHYGFTRDSGHFLGITAAARFTAQLRVRAQYESLYDQAGIMVRVDEQHWVKAGIELSDGRAMLSSVLTNPVSDWATPLTRPTPRTSGYAPPLPTASSVCRYRPMAGPGRWSGFARFPSPTRTRLGRCAARRSVPG
ncbi:hypothetical protein XA1314C_20640 [Xanthomonas arboricola]|uniref:DUF1349 domain-containing protein n=1 Tax=Xanthomonas arboricola TaxID=56448 RepID=A0AAU9HS39_9XANT|nr:hypothetical protein XA1314C_20640 [Xanthomonas arboricola]CAE6767539.1 hypothetical protein XA1314C_20640 [Xanthomonas arboricola]